MPIYHPTLRIYIKRNVAFRCDMRNNTSADIDKKHSTTIKFVDF